MSRSRLALTALVCAVLVALVVETYSAAAPPAARWAPAVAVPGAFLAGVALVLIRLRGPR